MNRSTFLLAVVEGLPPQFVIPALFAGAIVHVVDVRPDGSAAPARLSSAAELLREMAGSAAAVCPPRVYPDGKGGLIYAR